MHQNRDELAGCARNLCQYNHHWRSSMSTFAPALAQLAIDCESEGLTVKNSEKIAVELARFFNVQQDEIGILRLDKESLLFVHPAQLHNVGRIPLNSSA